MKGISLIHQEVCTIDNFPAKHVITTNAFGDCSYRIGKIIEEFQMMRLMALTKANCGIKIFPEHKDNIGLVIPYPDEKISRVTCDSLISFKLIENFKPMLASCTADCPTILITDKNGLVISIVHSGWPGTELNIIDKTIKRIFYIADMINGRDFALELRLENIIVAVWPGICKEHFEVGPEFRKKFPKYFVPAKGGKGRVSLKDVIIDQLLDSGIDPDNIFEIESCSFHSCDAKNNPLFHSFRREKNGLRNIVAIAL